MDIEWILTDEINAVKISDLHYFVTTPNDKKDCHITFSDEGRMLFDGRDIETEDFMAYVSMLDAVDEGQTHFEANGDI